MADTVLAAVMPAPNVPVEIREFAEPDLPIGGALLRTARSEVCGTDVHLWHGRLSGVPYPIIPGHVTTGTLDKLEAIPGFNTRLTLDEARARPHDPPAIAKLRAGPAGRLAG